MFKREELPEDGRDGIEDINAGIARVRVWLKDRIDTEKSQVELGFQEFAQCYLQGQIRRALMFLDGGKHALNGGYGLITLTCARSIYESAACIHHFCETLGEFLKADDVGAASKFILERMYETRFNEYSRSDDTYDFSPIGVSKQIKIMNQVVPGAQRAYAQLSEAAHPNALGALLYFARKHEADGSEFGNDDRVASLTAVLAQAGALFSLISSDLLGLQSAYLQLTERELQRRLEAYERRKREDRSSPSNESAG